MSLISLSPHATGSLRPMAFRPPAIDRLLFTAATAIAAYWRERQSVRWLADADDAVLRDLGIARSDIPRLVKTGRR